jgi:NADPH:quinone reductase-like Zn-dependent oxidoreductase
MKAIIQDRYGSPDALELSEIDRPATGDGEVLVRVRAASVHVDVWHAMRGQPYVLRILGSGLRKPKNRVPGTDVAGHVESVGTTVTRFRAGDEVFGQSFVGNLWRHGGALAEFAAAPGYRLERKPAGITFEQAAALPPPDRSRCRVSATRGGPSRDRRS